MKFFHTADWHLGKLVQGVYMTEGQRHVLRQFVEAVREEKPDAVIIAGDLYDRAVPPPEAVALLDEVLWEIVMELKTPVIAVAGNHDSPGRLQFGSRLMQSNGFHIVGQLSAQSEPVVLTDSLGEVHFHLVPYCDPSIVKHLYEDDGVVDHHTAMEKVIERIRGSMDEAARHVFVGHAFVTPFGEEEENTSDSERPLAIGGAEYVAAHLFTQFDYTALGHLHQAHYVSDEKIRYAGSPMKYSISEERHAKGVLIVDMDDEGKVEVKKRALTPLHDMRTVEGTMEEILAHPPSNDYVFVKLNDETPILFPMEKVKSVYPNAMHIERKLVRTAAAIEHQSAAATEKPDDQKLFRFFYSQMNDMEPDAETERIFAEVLQEVKGGVEK
ncbi:exonuclease SbcCD subunit D [Sporosarcina luteola]|uniref:exonuclease SbcCD subunit D n=1 Tax=Sporosarcina luteola TaxID=582850 RepID=UPI0020411008|nr:exonuclease SbcCD subunit D [Sporosarcina luteola]MCM3743685.1 exonuclease SbcCD subunit D [Sporosarcina luteola]